MSRCSLLAGEIDKIIRCFHEAKWKPIHGQHSTYISLFSRPDRQSDVYIYTAARLETQSTRLGLHLV